MPSSLNDFAQTQALKQDQRQDQKLKQDYEFDYGELDKGFEIKLPNQKKRKSNLKQVSTFNVLVKRKGKFNLLGSNLTESEAVLLGEKETLSRISRTFKLQKTNQTKDIFGIDEEITPNNQLFRNYKVRKGKAIFTPNQFIQRNSANLKSFGEQQALKTARLMKQATKFY
jgi:hypothetical protein